MAKAAHVRGEEVFVVRAKLPEAHDAEGWDLPETRAPSEVLPHGRWETRGDVGRGFEVVSTADAPEGDGVWVAGTEWREGLPVSPVAAAVIAGLARRGRHGLDVEDRVQAWEVAPGVRMLAVRTPTLPPATHTNTFVIGDEERVLIEPATPYADEQALMDRWVREARDDGARVVAVLATHHHADHVGGASMAARWGLPLWAHAETASRIRTPVERILRDEEVLNLGSRRLRCVHTPGHAPGHLCFLDETSGVMVAGDMVAGVGTILVDPSEGDMGDYLASLEKMRALAPRWLLPAHGGLIADAEGCLRFFVKHRLMREAKVAAALAAHDGAATAGQLVPVAYDDAPKSVWPLAALSVETHLKKLAKEGRAELRDGRWRALD